MLLKLALLGVFPFLPNSKYAPFLLAFNALVVNFLAAALAALNPIPPGTAICVIACPGAGKTKTIVYKICYMIIILKCNPSDFLIITFSKNAKYEL